MSLSHHWGCGRVLGPGEVLLGTVDAECGTSSLSTPEGDLLVRLSPVHQPMREFMTSLGHLLLYLIRLRKDPPRHSDLLLPDAERSALAATSEPTLIVTAFMLAVAYRVLWRPDTSAA